MTFLKTIPFRMLILLLLASSSLFGRNRTVGLFMNDPGAFEGYTLFAPWNLPPPISSTWKAD